MKTPFYPKILLGIFLSLLWFESAFAQATNFGLSPVGATQNLSVSTGNSSVTLNSSPGDTVLIQNTGATTAYVRCGPTAATTNDMPIQSGWGIALNCPPNNKVNAITASSTTTLTVTKGLGNFAMTGGGGVGGGAGAAVTIANGADIALGSTTDAVCSTPTSSAACTLIAITKAIDNNVASPIPAQAGTVIIGGVGIDQTTPGTTNGVQVNASVLPTGAATSANQTVAFGPVAPATATATKSDVIGCQYNSTLVTFTNGQQGQIACGPNGEFLIAGTVASAATDSGNPVKVGGKYNLTIPTFTDGQRGDLQLDSRGGTYVRISNGAGGFLQAAANTNADAVVTQGGSQTLPVAGFNYLFNGTTWDRVRGDATGGAWAQGAIASGASDSGNPVKAGGKYNSTRPTFTDGQRGDLQLDNRGNVSIVTTFRQTAAADGTSNNNTGWVGNADNSASLLALTGGFNYNGTTWDRQRSVAGDAQAGTGIAANVPMLWNGTTYDRAKTIGDPCLYANKSSAPINITTATTTSLVAVSGSTTVYVCGVSMTISEVITTPNTILFEYGTGASCTSPTSLTGKYGDGGVTAGIPIVVNAAAGGTVFKSAASAGICALTAIGATGSFQGVLTYVQQ